jgi:hypothetical protein
MNFSFADKDMACYLGSQRRKLAYWRAYHSSDIDSVTPFQKNFLTL